MCLTYIDHWNMNALQTASCIFLKMTKSFFFGFAVLKTGCKNVIAFRKSVTFSNLTITKYSEHVSVECLINLCELLSQDDQQFKYFPLPTLIHLYDLLSKTKLFLVLAEREFRKVRAVVRYFFFLTLMNWGQPEARMKWITGFERLRLKYFWFI